MVNEHLLEALMSIFKPDVHVFAGADKVVAEFWGPVLIPRHVLGSNSKFMLEYAAGPNRRALMILRAADCFALQILGTVDVGLRVNKNISSVFEVSVMK